MKQKYQIPTLQINFSMEEDVLTLSLFDLENENGASLNLPKDED